MNWTAAVASAEAFTLGEGPCWDAPRDRLLRVDVDAGTVHEGRLAGDRVVVTGSHHRRREWLRTTATTMLSPERLTTYPSSGRLFLAEVGVIGLPVTPWAGPDLGER